MDAIFEKTNKRVEDLLALEMRFDGHQTYVGKEVHNKDFNVDIIEIGCDTEEEWNTKMFKMRNELQRRKSERGLCVNTK